jgi:GntR family transcriptional regulator
MDFNDKHIIYLQIAEYAMDQILLENWKREEKIPSVRDLATLIQVNPNTVMRAYEHLQQKEIIVNKRGIGHFVAPDAFDRIRRIRRAGFLNNDLPELFRKMAMLGIGLSEIENQFRNYANPKKNEEK